MSNPETSKIHDEYELIANTKSSQESPILGYLVSCSNNGDGEIFAIREGDNKIGRSARANIILHEDEVHGRRPHAVIRSIKGKKNTKSKFFIKDVSQVETFDDQTLAVTINGKRLSSKLIQLPDANNPFNGQEIKHKDIVKIGRYELIFLADLNPSILKSNPAFSQFKGIEKLPSKTSAKVEYDEYELIAPTAVKDDTNTVGYLVSVSLDGEGEVFRIKEGDNKIGRNEGADIILNEDEVHGRRPHAVIRAIKAKKGAKSSLYIKDVSQVESFDDQTQAVTVNGKRIVNKTVKLPDPNNPFDGQAIKHKDIIKVGRYELIYLSDLNPSVLKANPDFSRLKEIEA